MHPRQDMTRVTQSQLQSLSQIRSSHHSSLHHRSSSCRFPDTRICC